MKHYYYQSAEYYSKDEKAKSFDTVRILEEEEYIMMIHCGMLEPAAYKYIGEYENEDVARKALKGEVPEEPTRNISIEIETVKFAARNSEDEDYTCEYYLKVKGMNSNETETFCTKILRNCGEKGSYKLQSIGNSSYRYIVTIPKDWYYERTVKNVRFENYWNL